MSNDNGIGMMCRLCMAAKGDFIPIFNAHHTESPSPTLSEKISLCTEVQIKEDDRFPNFICHHCLYQIEIWFSFKQLCLRTDSFLHKEATSNHSIKITNNADPLRCIADTSSDQSSQNCTSEDKRKVECRHTENTNNISVQLVNAPTRVYSRLRKFSCNICEAKFTSNEDLKSHKSSAHHYFSSTETVSAVETISATCCPVDQASVKTDPIYCGESCNNSSVMLQEDFHSGFEKSATLSHNQVIETATIVLNATSSDTFDGKSCKKKKASKVMSQLSLKYKKANLYPCPFCGTFIQRISRHIETQHSNEKDVKKLMSLEKKSVDRHRLLEELRVQGIIKHNKRMEAMKTPSSTGCD